MESTRTAGDDVANVLVCVASRHGSTAELAREVAVAISRSTTGRVRVDCLDVTAVDDVDEYSHVLVGSAVYLGRWMRDARRFVEQHQAALRAKPVWLFCSGPVGGMPAAADADHDMARLATLVAARGTKMFDGRIDTEKLSLAERAVTRLGHAPAGDFRDMRAVRHWAHDVAAQISATILSRQVVDLWRKGS